VNRFGSESTAKEGYMVETAEISEARKLGLDPDRLLKLKRVIEEDTAKGLYDGAAFLVAREGTVVMHEAVGHSDLANGRKAQTDDIFFIGRNVPKRSSEARVNSSERVSRVPGRCLVAAVWRIVAGTSQHARRCPRASACR
jgi:hypothetical protein